MNESTTIPGLLIETRGNITAVAKKINRGRDTVRKYARDFKGDRHRVIDGVLFTVARSRIK